MNKKTNIRKRFDKVVADYVAALLKMYDWDERYGYWVADDTTGIYAYGDNHFLSLSDVMYIVDNDVQEKTLEEWEEYCLWAHEFNQSIPNLTSWVKGCPRASNEEMEVLRKAKQAWENAIKETKEKYWQKYGKLNQ